MNIDIGEKYIKRIKFNLKKDFGQIPVVFLIIDDEVGKRISFYTDPLDKKTLEIFSRLTTDQKDCTDLTLDHLVQKTEWGVELFTDDTCILLIFHDKNNSRGKFRSCNKTMYLNFVDFVE